MTVGEGDSAAVGVAALHCAITGPRDVSAV